MSLTRKSQGISKILYRKSHQKKIVKVVLHSVVTFSTFLSFHLSKLLLITTSLNLRYICIVKLFIDVILDCCLNPLLSLYSTIG